MLSWLSGFRLHGFQLFGFPACWLLGFPACWLLGFPACRLRGFLASRFSASWLRGFSASRLHGFLASGLLGFWASWSHAYYDYGLLASWLRGFAASALLRLIQIYAWGICCRVKVSRGCMRRNSLMVAGMSRMTLTLWQVAACVLERVQHMDHCRLKSRNSTSTRKEIRTLL